MTTQSVLVEDCSPMIQYTPPDAWQDAPLNDTLASSYSGGSYHATSVLGANATFQFRGTGFTITGGRRPGYGSFSVSMDGQQLFDGNPVPESSPLRNTLAAIDGFPFDLHTLVLTNSGGAPIDIDTITFQAQIGSAGSNPGVSIDDSDLRINYMPSTEAWQLNSRPEFQNGTLHFSQDPNAAVSLPFTGNAVGIYGTASPDHADISVTIDGATVTLPEGSGSQVRAVRTGVLLYWADNLADGQHNVTVSKVQSDNTGPFFDIDSFVVYSAAATNASTTSASNSNSPPPPASNESNHPTASVGFIVGLSVAGAVILLLIGICLFLFFRIRRRRKDLNALKAEISPITPALPMQGVDRMELGGGRGSPFPFPPPASLIASRKSHYNKRLSSLSIAPSYYGGTESPDSNNQGSPLGGRSLPPVPRLDMTRIPGSSRSGVTDTTPTPPRPPRPRRPPTLHIGSLR